MVEYLEQLIELIEKATRPMNYSLNNTGIDSNQTIDNDFNIKNANEFIHGRREKISAITGIEPYQFPPADRLSSEQIIELLDATEELLAHFNFEFVFPVNVTDDVKYKFIIDHWDSQQKYSSSAMVQIETCLFEENKCPFPDFCSICEDFKDKDDDLHPLSFGQIDFDNLITAKDEKRIRVEVDKFKELIRKPTHENFITGIHNYCDGRCHSCPFTNRCSSYAINKELGEATLSTDDQPSDDQLLAVLKATSEIIEEELHKRGMDANELLNELTSEELCGIQEKHPITIQAESYAEKVKRWLESNQLEMESRLIAAENDEITKALESITWFQLFIPAKVARAISSVEQIDVDEHIKYDCNGSAKIALLAIDESLQGWQTFLQHIPHKEDSLLNLLKHLDKLKNNLELQFPDARSFSRPGFDDATL